MNNELYVIHLDNYLTQINSKLEMYELLLELVRSLRHDLDSGEASRAVRTLCSYEQKAHALYEEWDIPDAYAESGDPDDLSPLLEDELLPVGDDAENDADGGGELESDLPSVRLGQVSALLRQGADIIQEISRQMAVVEQEVLEECEKPEDDCAG